MVHKRLISPSSGALDKWYGTDGNKLVDHLEARAITDPFNLMGDVFSGYSWGAYYPGATSTEYGILDGSTTSGTATTGEDADGPYRQFATSSTIGTVAGKKKDVVWARRENNCFFQSKFTVSNATAATRICLGFTTVTASLTNTDTYLSTSDSGVMVGFRTTDANWSIFYNDGSGAMAVLSLGIAKDTLTHRLEIRADAATNTFIVRFDALNPITLASDIPAASTPLTMRHQIINATATDINLKMRGVLVGTRKL